MNEVASTVAEVADWIGISTRRVRELRADGVLPGGPRDPYVLRDCVRAYCAHKRPIQGRAAEGGSDGAPDIDGAKLRLYTARAETVEMLNAQMRGDSILAEDMVAVVTGTFEGVRAKILAIPTRAAPLLAARTTAAQIRDTLTEVVHAALEDIVDAGPACDTIASRARTRAGRRALVADPDGGDEAATPADRQPVGRRLPTPVR